MRKLTIRRSGKSSRKFKEVPGGWRGAAVRLAQSAAVALCVSTAISIPWGVAAYGSEVESEAVYGWYANHGRDLSFSVSEAAWALQAAGDPSISRVWRVSYLSVIGPRPADPNRNTFEIDRRVRYFVDKSAAEAFTESNHGMIDEVRIGVEDWRGWAVTDLSGRLAIEVADDQGRVLYRSPGLSGGAGPSTNGFQVPTVDPGALEGTWWATRTAGDGAGMRALCLVTLAKDWPRDQGVLAQSPSLTEESTVRICAFRTDAQVSAGTALLVRSRLGTTGVGALQGGAALTPFIFGGALAVDRFRRRLRRAASSDTPTLMENPRPNSLLGGLTADVNQSLARARLSIEQQRGFVADAAHELRSPLATLITTLEVAERHPHLVDPVQVNRTSLAQARRLERLTQDLLLLAQLDARTPLRDDVVDLADVVREVVSTSSDVGRPITLTVTGPTPAVGDRDAFRRIVQNLVDNAVRHAATGVEVALTSHNGAAAVSVTNDGDPIPAERAEQIFERFARLDDARHRASGGTGLGLAIARGLAERYGGGLDLEPGRRNGARFTWQIPVAR